MIVFDQVTRRFGDHVALDNVSLTITAGRVTAIVGESGSGKSTLLQHVNGLLRPDSGTVAVFGEPVDYDNLPAFRRRIGYAVQGIGLFPHLSAAANIALLARLQGWPEQRIAARREHLLSMMGLDTALLTRFPYELSGGQQQRVGLCRALMLEPPVLLLDEPFSGVDPITRTRIHEEFAALQDAEATTVVLVTHDLREARRLADDLVIIRDGSILQHGEAARVFDAPAEAYIAKLFEEHL